MPQQFLQTFDDEETSSGFVDPWYDVRMPLMSRNRPIIVFDLDCTLTFSHWHWFLEDPSNFVKKPQWMGYGRIAPAEIALLSEQMRQIILGGKRLNQRRIREMVPDNLYKAVQAIIIGGEQRWVSITRFLHHLSVNLNCVLFVSSKGNCQNVLALLTLMDWAQFFNLDNMRVNAYEPPCMQGAKPGFIRALKMYFPQVPAVYYIDDDPAESKAMPEYVTYFGPNIGLFKDQNGLDDRMMQAIVDAISH
jgi:hypothetical protein